MTEERNDVAPFEEPSKTELRARCEIAIDAAGYELVTTLVAIDPPPELEIRGRLKGDMQSVDGEGVRYCYFLRPNRSDVLPKWLVNFAAVAHQIGDVRMYVVVREYTPAFEKACRNAGAGLLVITDDNEFGHVVDFASTLPTPLEAAYKGRLAALRRDLEAKLHMQTNTLTDRMQKIGDLTRDMDTETADKYIRNVERQYKIWVDWGDAASRMLDVAAVNPAEQTLDAIAAEIEAGPILDPDAE